MSLVGNLEDLSLGDIMQLISLSQKSGVLALAGDRASGRIVFQSGLVHAACLNGQPDDLRALLVAGGLIEGAAFDEFAARAEKLGVAVEEVLAREGGLSAERIDALLRKSVEGAILEMFSWPSGEFSFDVRSKLEPDDPRLLLSSGINVQYLAMEGMRILDERMRDESGASHLDGKSESVVSELPREETGPEGGPPIPALRRMPVILIDPDVSVLEWIKGTIQDDFARIHVFQQAEQGLARIRQYLIRGELPVVLISTAIRIDRLSGIRGLSDFVVRLKTQAARLVVVGVQSDDAGSSPAISSSFDGVLARPSGRQLRESRQIAISKTASELRLMLRQILVDRSAAGVAPAAEPSTSKNVSVRELRDATGKLQEASSRGEILPVVLDFASELFARVAILIVREDRVFAIAGRGIAALEVDLLDSAPPVSLQILDSGWIRKVLQSGEPIQGPPTTPADRALLARFGGAPPALAYLGPIGSGGSTIAMLYGDQGPDGVEMPDTSGLEVVLHHAGLALDRAALERALWEADAAHR